MLVDTAACSRSIRAWGHKASITFNCVSNWCGSRDIVTLGPGEGAALSAYGLASVGCCFVEEDPKKEVILLCLISEVDDFFLRRLGGAMGTFASLGSCATCVSAAIAGGAAIFVTTSCIDVLDLEWGAVQGFRSILDCSTAPALLLGRSET